MSPFPTREGLFPAKSVSCSLTANQGDQSPAKRRRLREGHWSLGMEAVAVADAKNVLPVHKKNRIQVSNTKKPLFFYVNLAKKYMQQHNEVELSALGMAIATVVTISEILKNNGLAVEKKILTSTVDMKDETKGRLVQKAKIEILLGKTENFEDLMLAANGDREAVEYKKE
ncbi:uncharacterized protein At2g34160-like [Aristolochia californica]|uniref:uncharacterized protein At2g34160-like n=1 Tax=Aristolochia californica TaxID=171875 RepID=UPI0035E0CA52